MNHFSVNEFIWGRRYATLRRESFDSSIRKDFWIWSANHESLAALFLTYCFLSATQAPAYYDAIVYSNCLFILPAIGLVTVFFSMWISFFYQCFGNYLLNQRYHMFWMKKVPFMRIYTALGSTICFIFRLLTRSIIKECHGDVFEKYKWNCLPSGPNLGTTDEIGVCLMAFPLIFSAIYRELDMKLYLSIWGLTVAALFCAAHLGGCDESDDSMHLVSPRESSRSESSQMIASSTQIYPMMMSEDLGDGVVRGDMGGNDDLNGHVGKAPNNFMRCQLPAISEDCGKDMCLEVMDRFSERSGVVSGRPLRGSGEESSASNSTFHLYDKDTVKMNEVKINPLLVNQINSLLPLESIEQFDKVLLLLDQRSTSNCQLMFHSGWLTAAKGLGNDQ
eukprot:gene5509-6066_t